MPTVKNITLEEGRAILADFRQKGKQPSVKPHFEYGSGLFGHGILGWDFEATGCEADIYRAPPTLIPWVAHERSTWPFRYMTTKEPITLRIWNQRRFGEPEYTDKALPPGTRVKIVMASRFGDVGITDDLTVENGYHLRVDISELEQKFENFSNEP